MGSVDGMAKRKRSNRDRRAALFARGAAALERVLDVSDVYVCPLCLTPHGIGCVDGPNPHLTLEDVPPKNAGGRPLMLTCRECNNVAGHTIDARLGERMELMEALQGRPANRPPRLTATFATPDGEVTLKGLPGAGPSVRLHPEAVRHNLGEGPAQLSKVTIPLNDRHVQLSMLRAGFLAAFAQLGYRYALCSQLNAVRDQLANPDDQVIGQWVFYAADPTQRRERCLMEITDPAPCLMAMWDGFVILLPVHESPEGWESLVPACSTTTFPHAHEKVHLSGTNKWPWPSKMTMQWDHLANPAD